MKFTTVSCLLAALYSATFVLADGLSESAATPTSTPEHTAPETTLPPELVGEPKLEIRQNNVVDPGAAINPLQYPSITTQWVESTIGSSTTYVEIAYTQTFASVPDPWHTAGKGTIGYGTLTKKHKRDDAVARETGYAQPVVLEIPTEVVTQYIQPVTEVMVLQTFTLLPNMTFSNGTLDSNGTFSSNDTFYLNSDFNITNSTTTVAGNLTLSRNRTLPASLDPAAHRFPTASMASVG